MDQRDGSGTQITCCSCIWPGFGFQEEPKDSQPPITETERIHHPLLASVVTLLPWAYLHIDTHIHS